MDKAEKYWKEKFDDGGAWEHSGNPAQPHPILTSGRHTKKLITAKNVLKDAKTLREVSRTLGVRLLLLEELKFTSIDMVVAPNEYLAKSLSKQIATLEGVPCEWASPEKEGDGIHKKFSFKNHFVFKGKKILLFDDVLTSFSTLGLILELLKRAGGIILPIVAIVYNRSGLRTVSIGPVVDLIYDPIPTWDPKKCPLCAIASEAIRPEGVENWVRLTAKY